MTSHQLRGHIGGNMDGTKQWEVNITFFVNASNDDEAFNKVTNTLRYKDKNVAWAWIYTTQTNKEIETNDN